MLVPSLWGAPDPLRYVFLFAGLGMVMLPASFFYLKEVRPLITVQSSIKENKELIDTVQTTAIEMTELASDLQSLAFKHANQIASFVSDIRPRLELVPRLSRLAESEILTLVSGTRCDSRRQLIDEQ